LGKKLSVITEKEIEEAFGNARFGIDKFDVVKYGLLKSACGYYHGHTSTQILIELGLIDSYRNITEKGKENLYKWFKDESKTP